jgi:HSP20 family protein
MRWDQFQRLVLRELDARRAAATEGWRPSVDVYETAGGYVLTAELPGFSDTDVDLHFTADELVLRGQRPCVDLGPRQFLCVERPHGRFERRFSFPRPVDVSAVRAHLADGVLTVDIPKLTLTARRVDVS